MLNELYCLSKTLDDIGITMQEWQREYLEIPIVNEKAPCIRIWLNPDGSVHSFEALSAEQARTVRKFGNKQSSFPAFNMVPLYRVSDEEQVKAIKRAMDNPATFSIAEIHACCINDNWTGKSEHIGRCLKKSADDMLHRIENAEPADNIVSQLIKISTAYRSAAAFRNAIETCAFSYLEERREVALALRLLFYLGKKNAADPKKDCGSLSVVLDYYNWLTYGNPIASTATTRWINEKLFIYERTQQGNDITSSKDAFGAPYVKVDKPMPSIKVSGFGASGLTLRSMFHEQHCQERYRTFDSKSYPISAENRANTKKALEWIVADEKRDITWLKADSDEIIFSYTSNISNGLNPASVLAGPDKDDTKAVEMRFRKRLQDFSRVFKGLPPQNRPKYIRIFSIRKMDNARSKIIYTKTCDPEYFIDAANIWQQGCQNLPPMLVKEINTPFPLGVYRIVNVVWKRNGEIAAKKEKTKRMQYYEGLNLLLNEPTEQSILYFLRILLSNWVGLFCYMGNKPILRARKNQPFIDINQLGEALAVVALLLYKRGYKKEVYMENAAYQLGQLLKVSDDLHVMYCKVVRNGDVPPILAGNSVFIAASETPVQALAQLSQRMNPYITWAKQYVTKNVKYNEATHENEGITSGRAGMYLYFYEQIAGKLNGFLTADMRFNDFEKAQFFLGYLAALPFKSKEEKTENNDEMLNDNKAHERAHNEEDESNG